jgi:hypothetical protein
VSHFPLADGPKDAGLQSLRRRASAEPTAWPFTHKLYFAFSKAAAPLIRAALTDYSPIGVKMNLEVVIFARDGSSISASHARYLLILFAFMAQSSHLGGAMLVTKGIEINFKQ